MDNETHPITKRYMLFIILVIMIYLATFISAVNIADFIVVNRESNSEDNIKQKHHINMKNYTDIKKYNPTEFNKLDTSDNEFTHISTIKSIYSYNIDDKVYFSLYLKDNQVIKLSEEDYLDYNQPQKYQKVKYMKAENIDGNIVNVIIDIK